MARWKTNRKAQKNAEQQDVTDIQNKLFSIEMLTYIYYLISLLGTVQLLNLTERKTRQRCLMNWNGVSCFHTNWSNLSTSAYPH